MKVTNRQQVLGILAIAVVALWVADRIVLRWLLNTWEARAAEIAKLKQTVGAGETLLLRERYIREDWLRQQTNLFPAEPSAAETQMLKAFERWSQESQVGIRGIKPQWKRTADDRPLLECRVDAFGNLSATTRFLYNVEQDPLALRIEALDLTARDDNGEQLSLGLQVSGLLALPESGKQP
jgi:hypothetical protein